MLPSNINLETVVRKYLTEKGGWARVEECAKQFSKGDGSKRTSFYRWRKKIEQGKVEGFQTLTLPGNMTFLGLEGADPNRISKIVISDPNILDKVKTFLEKSKSTEPFTKTEAVTLAHFYQHDIRYMRNFSKLFIWIKRGARPEEKPELEH